MVKEIVEPGILFAIAGAVKDYLSVFVHHIVVAFSIKGVYVKHLKYGVITEDHGHSLIRKSHILQRFTLSPVESKAFRSRQ